MASTSQLREWWAAWECNPAKYREVAFPGEGTKLWKLPIADKAVPVFEAVAQIMATEPYLFKESAGGTYNCRNIAGSSNKSIHAYALALDLNPSKNPHRSPLTTDMPTSFIERMEGIKANGKQALVWGGRWSKPDAMHYQINVAPADCLNITWDMGQEEVDVDGPNGEPNWDEVSEWAQQAWTEAHEKGLLTDNSHPRDSLEVEELMVYLKRAEII